MSVGVLARSQTRNNPIGRFVKKPKGILLVILAALAVPSIYIEGSAQAAPGLFGVTVAAALMDVLIVLLRRRTLIFPSGAILTGAIIALVLRPGEPWYVLLVAVVVGIGSKHLFRTRTANIFNPAALALVVTYLAFGSGQSWWGALPDSGPLAVVLLLITGGYVADRVNKLPCVFAFLGAYFALFTLSSFFIDPARVAEVFRAPDLGAVLFFALFMLDDPPTSPIRYTQQIIFGLIVAGVSHYVFVISGAVCYLLVGLLVANAWEAYSRVNQRKMRQA